MIRSLLLAISFLLALVRAEVNVGDEVCAEGLVMDNFCIDRGAMLDPSGLDPFTDAEKHTVHCLVDVQMCIDSNFVILNDKGPDGNYTVGYRLDAAGTMKVIEVAKPVGDCDKGCTGTLKAGLRVGIKGTIVENGTAPYLISTDEIAATNDIVDYCGGGGEGSGTSSAVKTLLAYGAMVASATIVVLW